VVRVGVENEFLGVLDSDESLGGRDSRISALVQVVFPEPVGPETRMFLRLATASRMKASYCWLLKSFRSCCSVSSGVAEERRVVRKMPRWASLSDRPHLI